ncbi:MAG: prephenate dehydrogenase/arogenate dehydrogenase family protein [Chthoniobacterales bacterium]
MSSRQQNIAIFGPGLMGGSLLMALRQRQPHAHLRAWGRRSAALEELRGRGLVDFCSPEAAEVAAGADVVVLCVPVDKLADIARDCAGAVSADCLVTDVGSVKGPVTESLETIFSAHRNFVGSHPMCGSEATGLSAARADLYDNALCVVTPTANSRPEMTTAAEALWRSVGARVAAMIPAEHDRAAALVSHVPHVAAAALVGLLTGENPDFHRLCAGGFRDTTRVASGSPELWTAILSQNRAEAERGIGKLITILEEFRLAVAADDAETLHHLLNQARSARETMMRGD